MSASAFTTLALSGTAETPAAPIRGLILLSPFKKRFINLAKRRPPIVAITNETAPRPNIIKESLVMNMSAWVEAPTVTPNNMVTMSISFVRAVSANLSVLPDSFKRLPKNNIPKRGKALGEIKVVNNKATTGKIIFSFCETARGGFMRIFRSSFEISNLINGG